MYTLSSTFLHPYAFRRLEFSHYTVIDTFHVIYLGVVVLQRVTLEAEEHEAVAVRTDLRWGPCTRRIPSCSSDLER